MIIFWVNYHYEYYYLPTAATTAGATVEGKPIFLYFENCCFLDLTQTRKRVLSKITWLNEFHVEYKVTWFLLLITD